MSREKRMDFELLRLIAIVLVVFNHTQEWGFQLYLLPGVSRVNFHLSLVLGVLCKVAVPLFLLVSGGLLLGREETILMVLRKRVLRIFAVLVVFSAVLYGFWSAWGYVTPSPGDFLRRLIREGISTPYWYLYLYLGLMLLLPLLQVLVRNMETRHFYYLAGLHGLLCGLYSISVAAGFGGLHPDFRLDLAEPYLFYFLMGYFLACRMDWQRFDRKRLLEAWGMAALAVGLMYLMCRAEVRRYGEATMNYHMTLIGFPVFAVYASVRRFCEKHAFSPKLRRVIGEAGSCVFGTYLLEGILRHYLQFVFQALQPRIHMLPACFAWVLAVVLSGLGVTWLLRRIPWVRRWL